MRSAHSKLRRKLVRWSAAFPLAHLPQLNSGPQNRVSLRIAVKFEKWGKWRILFLKFFFKLPLWLARRSPR
jgi:hypothetical protein